MLVRTEASVAGSEEECAVRYTDAIRIINIVIRCVLVKRQLVNSKMPGLLF